MNNDHKRSDGPPPVGKKGFEAHFDQLTASVIARDESPELHRIAEAMSRARQWAESGDYLAALQAIGGLKIALSPDPSRIEGLSAPDVEQALSDLRRAVEHAGATERAAPAAALWRAAREEFLLGAWEAAIALVQEGHGWLQRR